MLYWLLCLGAGVVIAFAQLTATDAHQLKVGSIKL